MKESGCMIDILKKLILVNILHLVAPDGIKLIVFQHFGNNQSTAVGFVGSDGGERFAGNGLNIFDGAMFRILFYSNWLRCFFFGLLVLFWLFYWFFWLYFWLLFLLVWMVLVTILVIST